MREQKRRILKEQTKGLYTNLPKSLYDALKEYCFDNNMSKAYLITDLIEKKLEKSGFVAKKDRES